MLQWKMAGATVAKVPFACWRWCVRGRLLLNSWLKRCCLLEDGTHAAAGLLRGCCWARGFRRCRPRLLSGRRLGQRTLSPEAARHVDQPRQRVIWCWRWCGLSCKGWVLRVLWRSLQRLELGKDSTGCLVDQPEGVDSRPCHVRGSDLEKYLDGSRTTASGRVLLHLLNDVSQSNWGDRLRCVSDFIGHCRGEVDGGLRELAKLLRGGVPAGEVVVHLLGVVGELLRQWLQAVQ